MFDLGKKILALLEIAFAFWNNQVTAAFSLLKSSPKEFSGGSPWSIVERLEPIFVAIGSSLVVLFFVIGFCAESVEIRQEFRFEAMLRMFIRIGFAEFMVVNHLEIMEKLFESTGALIELIGTSSMVELKIGSSEASVIKSLDFGESLVFLLIAGVMALVVIACGFFMLYTVYFRFLKIMVITPLAALAFATMSGNRDISHTALSYARHFVSLILEAVAMAIAILLCNAIVNSGVPQFAGDFEPWAKTLIYLAEMVFSVALTVGTVKGSQQLVGKALGL